MKLFVIAALVAVAAAGRLEHLERSYLPPDNNSIGSARSSFGFNGGFGSGQGSFGSPSSRGSFGSPSPHGSFGIPSSQGSFGGRSGGAFGASGAGLARHSAGGSFAGATSNQYLPPNQGSSASIGARQFAGSPGFGAQNFPGQQYNGNQAAPRTQYGAPQASSSFGSPSYQGQYSQQSAATSRQYLAPKTSFQNTPQQPFDEETGYRY